MLVSGSEYDSNAGLTKTAQCGKLAGKDSTTVCTCNI